MTVKAVKDQPEKEPLGLDALTAGETAMAERTAGQSITTLGNDGYGQASLIGALGWVLYRRSDPKMTFQKYMDSRTLAEITKELGLSEDAEEDPGKDGAGSTSSS